MTSREIAENVIHDIFFSCNIFEPYNTWANIAEPRVGQALEFSRKYGRSLSAVAAEILEQANIISSEFKKNIETAISMELVNLASRKILNDREVRSIKRILSGQNATPIIEDDDWG